MPSNNFEQLLHDSAPAVRIGPEVHEATAATARDAMRRQVSTRAVTRRHGIRAMVAAGVGSACITGIAVATQVTSNQSPAQPEASGERIALMASKLKPGNIPLPPGISEAEADAYVKAQLRDALARQSVELVPEAGDGLTELQGLAPSNPYIHFAACKWKAHIDSGDVTLDQAKAAFDALIPPLPADAPLSKSERESFIGHLFDPHRLTTEECPEGGLK
jgi:hypothetical protein